MPRSKEIPEDMRRKVIEAHLLGKGYKNIAKALSLPKTTIRGIVHKWRRFGTVMTLPRSGRPPKISPNGRQKIIQEVLKNPCTTPKDLQATLASANIHVHDSTIRKFLGIHARPSLSCYAGIQRLFREEEPVLEARGGTSQGIKVEQNDQGLESGKKDSDADKNRKNDDGETIASAGDDKNMQSNDDRESIIGENPNSGGHDKPERSKDGKGIGSNSSNDEKTKRHYGGQNNVEKNGVADNNKSTNGENLASAGVSDDKTKNSNDGQNVANTDGGNDKTERRIVGHSIPVITSSVIVNARRNDGVHLVDKSVDCDHDNEKHKGEDHGEHADESEDGDAGGDENKTCDNRDNNDEKMSEDGDSDNSGGDDEKMSDDGDNNDEKMFDDGDSDSSEDEKQRQAEGGHGAINNLAIIAENQRRHAVDPINPNVGLSEPYKQAHWNGCEAAYTSGYAGDVYHYNGENWSDWGWM